MKAIKSTLVFASGTFLSRISGLVRDQVLFGVFGATGVLDAFLLAFRIPNLFREMLAEGALGSSFTKVYSQLRESDQLRAAKLLGDALLLGVWVLVALGALGILVAPIFVDLMTLGAASPNIAELKSQATMITRWLFPYLGIAIVGSIVAGALYEKGRFFLSAIAPLAFNLCFIAGATLFADVAAKLFAGWFDESATDPRMIGLAIGVLLGGIFQVLLQLRTVIENLKFYKMEKVFPWSQDLKNVFRLMLPASLAASTGPINLIINTRFAADVGEGAISWLVVAFRLFQLPIGIFGVAMGVVVLPQLAKTIKGSTSDLGCEVGDQLKDGLIWVFALLAPCAAILVGSAEPIMVLLFQHGAFTAFAAEMSAQALAAYALGIFSYGAVKVLTAFYFASERTGYALRVALVCVVVNFLGNVILVDQMGHVGLALTAALTISVNAALLGWGIRRYRFERFGVQIFKVLIILLFVVILAILCQKLCLAYLNSLDYLSLVSHKVRAAINLTVAMVVVLAISWIAAYFWLGRNPIRALKHSLMPK